MTERPAPSAPLTAAEILASITDDQAAQLELQLLAASAAGDGVEAVCDFGELVFGKIAAKHHRKWITEMLTPPTSALSGPRVAIVAPPESAKTTWGTVIKTAWFIGKYPDRSFGIGSAGDDAADDMTKAVVDTIEHNPRWRLVFPHVVPDKQRGWSSDGYHVRRTDLPEGEWERLRYGDKNPTLVGGGVGSARWNGLRLTGGLTLDDAHDRKSKTQDKTNTDTVGFFSDTAEYRITGQGFMHIQQTRWNAKDIISIVKNRPDFVVFEHKAIETVDGLEVSYWPEVHTLEKLQSIRGRNLIDFELQFQGNDRAVEGTILKAAWLHDFPFLDFRKEWNRYLAVDPAMRLREIVKKADDPDDFGLAVMADTGSRLVVEAVFLEELYMADAEDFFFAKVADYRPKNCGIETNGAAAKMYYQNLLKRQRKLGVTFVITPITRTADKGTYYATMAPYFTSGQVLVSDEPTPGLLKFRQQWVTYPRGHDDGLDCVYNCWHISNYLLPIESAPAAAERAARLRSTMSVAQQINKAYS